MNASPSARMRLVTLTAAILLSVTAGTVQAAQPFRLRTATGEIVEFSGKSTAPATVLFFWATWCPYCKALMPHLQSVLYQYGTELQFYAINIMEDGDPVEFLEETGYPWMPLLQGDEVAKAYRVRGTPGLFVVDRSGALVFELSRVQISAAVRKHLSGADSRQGTAGRIAPLWAAELRRVLDPLIDGAR